MAGGVVAGVPVAKEVAKHFIDQHRLGVLAASLVHRRLAASQRASKHLSPHFWLLLHREKTIKSRPHQPALDRHNHHIKGLAHSFYSPYYAGE